MRGSIIFIPFRLSDCVDVRALIKGAESYLGNPSCEYVRTTSHPAQEPPQQYSLQRVAAISDERMSVVSYRSRSARMAVV